MDLIHTPDDVEALEVDLLCEAIYQRFGQDFRGFRRDVLASRLRACMNDVGVDTLSQLQSHVLHDGQIANRLMQTVCRRSSVLFETPEYYRVLRQKLGVWLRSCAAPQIWIAECACAEDLFSLAILLADEDLLHRVRIFATASNEALLHEAAQASFDPQCLPLYQQMYRASGGTGDLNDFVQLHSGRAVFRPELTRAVTWAQHNLATDASFNEFELIHCRHVLDDYGPALRTRSLKLFHDSLVRFGILGVTGVGGLESVTLLGGYAPLDRAAGVFRRIV